MEKSFIGWWVELGPNRGRSWPNFQTNNLSGTIRYFSLSPERDGVLVAPKRTSALPLEHAEEEFCCFGGMMDKCISQLIACGNDGEITRSIGLKLITMNEQLQRLVGLSLCKIKGVKPRVDHDPCVPFPGEKMHRIPGSKPGSFIFYFRGVCWVCNDTVKCFDNGDIFVFFSLCPLIYSSVFVLC